MNSCEKMLEVLELFDADHPEWSAEDIQARLGYSQSTLYRHLKALSDFGFLSSFAGRGYCLGPRIIELDFRIRQNDPMIDTARPVMEELGREVPSVGLLCRRFRNRVLCVHQQSTTDAIHSSYERGLVRPLLRGAASLVILAHLSPYQLDRLHEDNGDQFQEAGLGATLDEVKKRLGAIRKSGWMVTRGEVTPDVIGIAAPILDAKSNVEGSLSLTLPARDVDEAAINNIGARVLKGALQISVALG